jgi:cell volume regulation protein A
MIDAIVFIVLIGITLLLGYIGNHIFSKTMVPDVVWLFLFGLLITHFGLVPRDPFIAISNLLASIALFIILFDAGLNMNIQKFLSGFSRSFLLAVLGFTLSTLAVAGLAFFVLRMDLLQGLLLGSILGGTSSALVISMVSKLRMRENAKTTLSLESVLTDPIVIVVSMALMALIVPGAFTAVYSPVHGIVSAFSIGIAVGLIAGIIWLFVLDRIRGKNFDYMLTLGLLFLLYAGVEYSGGSGAIAALFFGIVLGNGKMFSEMFKLNKKYVISEYWYLRRLQNEITFFIRSFFFVFLGLVVTINQSYILYGALFAAAVILVRLAAVQISAIGLKMTPYEKNILRIMAPRGLAAAILAQLAIIYGVPGADALTSIIFVVILATAIYSSIFVAALSRREEKRDVKARRKLARHASVKK